MEKQMVKKETIDNETGEVMEVKTTLPTVPLVDQLDVNKLEESVKKAEKFLELKDRIIKASLKATKPEHWSNQNGKPFLEAAGTEIIARQFGVSIDNIVTDQIWHEDSKGRYYEFKVTANAHFQGATYSQIGSATSRDKFFARAKGREKEICEISISDIRKKATTNCLNRLIKSILGLTHVTFDDLKAVGIDINKVATVDYKQHTPEVGETPKGKEPVKDKELKEGSNWWTSDFQGKTYFITHNENSKLTHNQLVAMGMKYNQEKKTYSRLYTQELEGIFADNFITESTEDNSKSPKF